jgi:tRNA-dihydrouridine synthase
MAARGAQGNPFLFAEIRAALRGEDYVPPSARARLDAALRHISEYIAAHGDGAFADMRKHIAWYTKGMYGSTELRRRVNNCGSTAELSELVRRFRDEVSD